jgi:flagellar hook-associated protein 3 FlgL
MAFEQVRSNVSKNRSDMAELQNQAATQKKLTKPSLDPVSAAKVLSSRTEIAGDQQFIKSIQSARSFLEYSDQSLSELTDILTRAKELAINQSNDASGSESTRHVAATEVHQIFEQSVQIGNRKLADRFIFGGFRTNRPPFDQEGNYKGDSGEIKIAVNKEAHIAMNMPGDKVFTGEKVRVNVPEAGEAPDSAAPARGADGALLKLARARVRGPASESDAVSAAQAGNVAAASSENQTWTTKGVNVFQILSGLETAMRTNDKQAIQEAMDLIDEATTQVINARATLGARMNTLNGAYESHTKGAVEAKGVASQLEDADTFELVSDINKSESTLKASLETSGKLIQPSLLDFLK